MTLRERYLGGNNIHVGDGWADIVDALLELLDDEVKRSDLAEFKVLQIKEKFAGLRFYTHGGNDVTRALVGFAEKMALRTCEACGDRGALDKQRSWMKTLCPTHAEQRKLPG